MQGANVKPQTFKLAEINELHEIDALIQERRTSSALVMELRLFALTHRILVWSLIL